MSTTVCPWTSTQKLHRGCCKMTLNVCRSHLNPLLSDLSSRIRFQRGIKTLQFDSAIRVCSISVFMNHVNDGRHGSHILLTKGPFFHRKAWTLSFKGIQTTADCCTYPHYICYHYCGRWSCDIDRIFCIHSASVTDYGSHWGICDTDDDWLTNNTKKYKLFT